MRTTPAPDHPFRRHSENLVAVRKGLTQIERLHKQAIRVADAAAIETLARFHSLTVGMMAELRLSKILWDPGGFNERERKSLLRIGDQEGRWKAVIDFAFRRHFSVPFHRELDRSTTSAPAAAQYAQILGLVDSHLHVLIADRNKTAHGQWAWHFNYSETAATGPASSPLNYRAVKARSDVIILLAELVHILVVSEPTFQRSFDAVYADIQALIPFLDGSDYEDYVQSLRRSRRR